MKSDCHEINIIKRHSVTENGIAYRYELILFEGTATASFGIDLYGISAELEASGSLTSYRTGGLFSDKEKALRFFDMITQKLATPIDIPYIIEDSFCF